MAWLAYMNFFSNPLPRSVDPARRRAGRPPLP
ncbi:hypothetical protein V2J09_000567 [Rumex salicifolius]